MSSRKAILVLEDESTLAKALKTILVREGFAVTIAEDGFKALDEVKRGGFDLAILDLVTPGVDGFEVLKHIRHTDTTVPIFILSNLSEEEHKSKAMDIGASRYFVKAETLLGELTTHIKELVTSDVKDS